MVEAGLDLAHGQYQYLLGDGNSAVLPDVTHNYPGSRTSILHIIGQLGAGGSERQLGYLARALSRRGWEQLVISLSSGGVWKDFLLKNQIPVAEVEWTRFKPYRVWQLHHLAARERPSIVMAWSLHAGTYAQTLLGIGRPVRVLGVRFDYTTEHETGRPGTTLRWGRRALEHADYLVSNSWWNLEPLRRVGVHLPSSRVIPNIVFAAGRAHPGEQTPRPRIVAAGTLNARKSYDVLLRAMESLVRAEQPFELLIAGSGPERGKLEDLCKKIGLAGRVRFLGHVSDVPKLMAAAHIAVHPSRSEGLSNTILEAMAEGLPVVATSVGGAPEIIHDDVNGLLVPPDQPERLAQAIGRLISDPDARAYLGSNAYQSVRRSFAEERIATRYDDFFRSIIRRPSV